MASLLLRPGVADFIEIVAANRNLDLQIEEIVVKKGSKMHKNNPKGDTIVDEGNKLIAIGERGNLEKLKDF